MSSVQAKLSPVQNAARKARRRLRYDARSFLGFQSSLKRVRFCGKDAVKGVAGMEGVTVLASGTGSERRAGLGQVQHCGSTWACPVCSHKISAVRAQEIADSVIEWHARGGRIVFLTLTMKHNRKQSLDDLWTNGISAGWGRATSGRQWKTDQELYGTVVPRTVKSGKNKGKVVLDPRIGFARVVETTHGAAGWHVHIHALLFVRGDITADESLDLGLSMFGRWRDAIVAAGFDAPSSDVVRADGKRPGVDVRLLGPNDASKVGKYFEKSVYGYDKAGKVGWEAAGGAGKNGRLGNRTPFQILADCAASGPANSDGEINADMALWWEWEEASKGKRQLTWSPWLRDLLAPDVVEKTDEEIAAEALENGAVVLRFRDHQFRAIQPLVAELLDAVEADDDLSAAHAWLMEHCRAPRRKGQLLGDPLYAPGEFSKPLVLVA